MKKFLFCLLYPLKWYMTSWRHAILVTLLVGGGTISGIFIASYTTQFREQLVDICTLGVALFVLTLVLNLILVILRFCKKRFGVEL